jgi:mannitol-1-phosphate 5-dehydrogenase
MSIALQFGAGNIGRGFMGQLFSEAGWETIFIDQNLELVHSIREKHKYTLRLLDAYSKRVLNRTIRNIDALHTSEEEQIKAAVREASVICTAVGIENLEAIAPLVARGIELRREEREGEKIDIYLCENDLKAADLLRSAVFRQLTAVTRQWTDSHIGFVGTSVARIVPSQKVPTEDPLSVSADSYHKLPFDGKAARGKRLPIEGMYPVENFQAEVERKLYTHNVGHCALAYIGYLKGYRYVHEVFSDAFLLRFFEGALDETSKALMKKYPAAIRNEEQRAIRRDVRIRFSNPMIEDTVQRVARSPIRKLGPQERLIGAAKLCLSQDIFPDNVASICAAALCFDYREDIQAVELQKMIEGNGVEHTVGVVTGIRPDSLLGAKIISEYEKMKKMRNE